MNRSIFKGRNEKKILLNLMWEILLRETQVEDDAGCNWFTLGDDTYISDTYWHVSSNKEVAELVNAINALKGCPKFINQKP